MRLKSPVIKKSVVHQLNKMNNINDYFSTNIKMINLNCAKWRRPGAQLMTELQFGVARWRSAATRRPPSEYAK